MVRPEHVHSAREGRICYIHVYTYAGIGGEYLVYLVDFGVNSMPCLQLQVVTLHVLCARAEPRPSLDLIPAPQCRTPKPVDDTAAGDLLSLARCSET